MISSEGERWGPYFLPRYIASDDQIFSQANRLLVQLVARDLRGIFGPKDGLIKHVLSDTNLKQQQKESGAGLIDVDIHTHTQVQYTNCLFLCVWSHGESFFMLRNQWLVPMLCPHLQAGHGHHFVQDWLGLVMGLCRDGTPVNGLLIVELNVVYSPIFVPTILLEDHLWLFMLCIFQPLSIFQPCDWWHQRVSQCLRVYPLVVTVAVCELEHGPKFSGCFPMKRWWFSSKSYVAGLTRGCIWSWISNHGRFNRESLW